jgi:hypothetical protein
MAAQRRASGYHVSTTGSEESRLVIGVTDTALDLRIAVDARGMARITRLTTAGGGPHPSADGAGAALPLLDVIVAGEGRAWSSGRYCEFTGRPFRYVSHQESSDGNCRELRVELRDAVTGLQAEVCCRVLAGAGALRAWTVLRNPGAGTVTIEAVTFTMATALLGRLYLSGHLDTMSPAQQALVAEAVRVHKRIRAEVASAVPFWPLGLPRWTDRWIALGLHTADPHDGDRPAPGGRAAAYLTVWHRGALTPASDTGSAAPAGDPPAVTLPVPQLRGRSLTPRVLYPGGTCEEVAWDPAAGTLTVRLPRTPSACVLTLGY